MYIAAIDGKGNIQITAGFLDDSMQEITQLLQKGHAVILDTSNERLETMASQMGLAVIES